MNDYRKQVLKTLGVFLVICALISIAQANVGQPWDALLLALGFASIVWLFIALGRIDRTRE